MKAVTSLVSKTKVGVRQENGQGSGNGHIHSLSSLRLSSYEETVERVKKKLSKRSSLPQDLPKGEWTEQALRVLGERYLLKDEKGQVIETPEEMCWRVAWEMASSEVLWGKTRREVEEYARQYYLMLANHWFLPNSPTLMNAGVGNMLQYSACFVLPVDDSMEGIFDSLKYQAIIHKSGGGTGFAFSRLRPRGAFVRGSQGVASGPVSFMRIFDAATNEVKQGGKRRGANMGILRVDHPDVLEFIHCKEEGGVTNFNISVAVTNKFWEAYEKDEEYELVAPQTGEVVGKLRARDVFEQICEGAWRTGDPGMVFIDRINEGTANPVPSIGPIESTNPCGEQPLYPYDSCNLGSIFLTYFVKEEEGRKVVDWEKLREVTRLATRFLDSVIEMNPYPIPQIRQTSLAIRRIGLGVGGWADMLIELGVPYDSEDALSLGEQVMRVIQEESVNESQQLARERGSFPLWPASIYKDEAPRRNSTVTTIAPTGTISIIAGSSSGIEPLFAVAYQHIVRDKHLDRRLVFVNPYFEKVARERGFYTEELMQEVGQHGTVREIEEIPHGLRAVFGTAHEIGPEWHIRHQAVFQKYTENAVSKTINLRNEATIEDIKKAYLSAWETGCKGITVFRDGSKGEQVLNLGTADPTKKQPEATVAPRPLKVAGATYRMRTPVGSAFITVNEDENGQPLEVFLNVGKAGSDVTGMAEALGRLISTSLRFRGNLSARERVEAIARQLSGIGGSRSIGYGPDRVRSVPDAIAKALALHLNLKLNGNGVHVEEREEKQEVETTVEVVVNDPPQEENTAFDLCPTCGATALAFEEGCAKCYECGYSEC
ncbi:vitamin B12-dependent ribonucleotide reductase [Candidatus Microgenomates bacterium]|nr:vitamin B12-dependent ribonucleotide reductase [Candidatus Microgenomates bacterium]